MPSPSSSFEPKEKKRTSEMDPSTEVAGEIPSLIRLYKDGRVERLVNTDFVSAGFDPSTGVSSKDVVIDPSNGVSARLYSPRVDELEPGRKLPLLVFYHGGGFCIGSAFSSLHHNYINSLSFQAKILVVSVEYRLAPEHPVPAAYDDAWLALKWVESHKGGGGEEEWLLKHADFKRVFVAGDSAGGNIAHNMAVMAGSSAVWVEGVVLVHPYFWGSEKLESEMTSNSVLGLATVDATWPFVCKETIGNDDPRINPFVEGAPAMERLGCKRMLVCVAEKDVFRGRDKIYYEKLKESGWEGEVELLESEGEDHVFHLYKPQCLKASEMMQVLVEFFNRV